MTAPRPNASLLSCGWWILAVAVASVPIRLVAHLAHIAVPFAPATSLILGFVALAVILLALVADRRGLTARGAGWGVTCGLAGVLVSEWASRRYYSALADVANGGITGDRGWLVLDAFALALIAVPWAVLIVGTLARPSR